MRGRASTCHPGGRSFSKRKDPGTRYELWGRPGPVVVNYGSDKLRFVRPVFLGDTIRARLECVEKRVGAKPVQDHAVGVVDWKVPRSRRKARVRARSGSWSESHPRGKIFRCQAVSDFDWLNGCR